MSIYINKCIYIQIYIYIYILYIYIYTYIYIYIYIDDVIFFTTSLFINDWAPLMLYSTKVICNYEVTFRRKNLKVGLLPSKKNCVICFIESRLKMMKNAFFILISS